MRVIMLMFDSLNRHMLSPYGCDTTNTPNFKRLSEKSVTFKNCYSGSMPCMPARRELHTGRYNFLHRAWGPLETYDDSMPQILKEQGIYTHIISDHMHYWEDGGANYHTKYSSWEIVRGQEKDPWKSHIDESNVEGYIGRLPDCFKATIEYCKENGYDCQKEMQKLSLDFLEKNKDCDNWFLQIEHFDPHEPFYTGSPQDDTVLPESIWPNYGKSTESENEIENIRSHYCSLLSMCDETLGKLLDFMDDHNMWEDTMLIVNTDHGFLLNEHDSWGKCVIPFYNEIVHTPLFIWDPRADIINQRRNSLVQIIDIAPTILDYFGIDIPNDVLGKPLKNTIQNDTSVHDYVLFGLFGAQVNITDGRYVYMRGHNDTNSPLYEYIHVPLHIDHPFSREEMMSMKVCKPFSFTKDMPLMKINTQQGQKSLNRLGVGQSFETHSMLYDLQNDPEQKSPINDSKIEERMIDNMVWLMLENDAPHEQYIRLGLESEYNKIDGRKDI